MTNRGIFVASSRSPTQLPPIAMQGEDLGRRTSVEDNRIERILNKSRSASNVRSLDPDHSALVARATRLSALYGISPDSELARKGAGERPLRRKRPLSARSSDRKHKGSRGVRNPGSSCNRERRLRRSTALARKHNRTKCSALKKAEEAAARYTIDISAGMKAFDGPPLNPQDVKDLMLRNFRIRLTKLEAMALITQFAAPKRQGRSRRRPKDVSIEHAKFLHAIQRLRRRLLKKPKDDTTYKRNLPALKKPSQLASLQSAAAPCQSKDNTGGKRALAEGGSKHQPLKIGPVRQPLNIGKVVRALEKVDQAAATYDRRRLESLRQADLSRATSPRAFGGVLLARFNVRINHSEQQELVALLRDKSGAIDVEHFRAYFLSLVGENERRTTDSDGQMVENLADDAENSCGPFLPLFPGSFKGIRDQVDKASMNGFKQDVRASGESSGGQSNHKADSLPVDVRVNKSKTHLSSEIMACHERSSLRLKRKVPSVTEPSRAPPWGQGRPGG